MKALSIKQPWAWAICNLPEPFKKNIENRTWDTKYRGEFLVHASKKFDMDGYEPMKKYLEEMDCFVPIPEPKEFVTGAIVGKAILVDTVKTHESIWFEGNNPADGIVGFELDYGIALKEPIPYKGQLNFFEIPDEVIQNKEFNYNGILKPLTPGQIEEIYKRFYEKGIERESIEFLINDTPEFVCLGCGCSDSCACAEGCHWLLVDVKSGFGICSECEDEIKNYL